MLFSFVQMFSSVLLYGRVKDVLLFYISAVPKVSEKCELSALYV
jgi:hypothetical protein